jgi:hypothetical protein
MWAWWSCTMDYRSVLSRRCRHNHWYSWSCIGIQRRATCSTSFSNTTTSSNGFCFDFISGEDSARRIYGTGAASRTCNDFPSRGGYYMYMLLWLWRIATDIDGQRSSRRIKRRGRSRARRISISVRHCVCTSRYVYISELYMPEKTRKPRGLYQNLRIKVST